MMQSLASPAQPSSAMTVLVFVLSFFSHHTIYGITHKYCSLFLFSCVDCFGVADTIYFLYSM